MSLNTPGIVPRTSVNHTSIPYPNIVSRQTPVQMLEQLGANPDFVKFAEANPQAARNYLTRLGVRFHSQISPENYNSLVQQMKARFG